MKAVSNGGVAPRGTEKIVCEGANAIESKMLHPASCTILTAKKVRRTGKNTAQYTPLAVRSSHMSREE
jgi:hypothetical protein